MKNEEPSPQVDKESLEPAVSSLTPCFHYRHEETAPLESKTERQLNEHFIASQGMVVATAAKELSDEGWRL